MTRFKNCLPFIRPMAAAIAAFILAGAAAAPAFAQGTAKLDSGDTAWMLTSTALVLLMTIPGLALFYGGMVRKKNVLPMLMQCFAITCLVTVLWMVVGYSLAFADGNAFVGGLGKAFLVGIGVDTLTGTIPETLFMVFQMTFAIITPALITGAFADRMKFSALMWFAGAWVLVVYAPITHWVWGGGFLGDAGVLDFAGGMNPRGASPEGEALMVDGDGHPARVGVGDLNVRVHDGALSLEAHRAQAGPPAQLD